MRGALGPSKRQSEELSPAPASIPALRLVMSFLLGIEVDLMHRVVKPMGGCQHLRLGKETVDLKSINGKFHIQ
jgi:hypothetical protein